MKLFTAWMLSAGLIFSAAAAAANAQVLAPDQTGGPAVARVPDVDGAYAAMPREAPLPAAPRGGPMLLPPTEVYTVLRDNGFLPTGIPQRRGQIYTISVIGRGHGDGRLIIDARDGRIVRFVPAYRAGRDFDNDLAATNGPVGPLRPSVRGAPRPPAPIPHVASRTVPVPKPSPLSAKPAAQPAQQSAAVQPKPAGAQAAIPPAAAPAAVQAQPSAPAIQPTQEMPQVQGLE